MRVVIRRLCAVLICSLWLSGCNDVPVAQEVGQKEANQIVALLAANGIPAAASRESSGKGRYSVNVSSRNYSPSVVLMSQNDLPRDDQSPINDLIAQHGLVPNSREVEALRLDRALALELQELLAAHPAVVSAKVAVRLNFLGNAGEPAVSAVIQASAPDALTADAVAELVGSSVPGVKRDNIKVLVQSAPNSAAAAQGEGAGVYRKGQAAMHVPLASFLWWRVAEGDAASITLVASLCLLIMLVAGALLGYWYGFFKQSRQVIESDLPELGPKALRIERSKREVLLNK